MLVLPAPPRLNRGGAKKDRSLITEDDFFVFLESRVGKLDGIVISGGEPTQQSDLPRFLTKIKKIRYKIKLDTNGTNPEMLKKLINPAPREDLGRKKLVDYIAMDIKGPLDKYEKITGISKIDLKKIKKSIKIIMDSNLPYEFRTTIVPGLLSKDNIGKMGQLIKGADKWFLQQFKSDVGLVNENFQKIKPYSEGELRKMREIGEKHVRECEIR